MKPQATKPWRTGRSTHVRGGTIFVIVLLLLFILGGIVALVIGLEKRQEAESLAVAPVCASGQAVGCKLNERVTVVDLYSVTPARGVPTRYAKVQKPDGSLEEVGENEGSDLYDLLYISEELNAEIWNGDIIELDDDAGHSMMAVDSPVVTGTFMPMLGVGGIVGGGALLFLFIRALRRANR